MKKFMLVGAAGLALAGVAFAAQGETTHRSVDTFKSAQKAAVGGAGSATRADVLTQLRAGIASGKIDPRTVLFLIDENLLPGSGSAVSLAAGGAPTEGVPGGPGVIYYDPFSTYTLTNYTAPPGSLISLVGQTNPSGRVYTNVDIEFGASDDTTMTEGDNNPATPIFTPPLGGGIAPLAAVNAGVGSGIDNVPPYLAIARRTAADSANQGFTLGINIIHDLSVPGTTAATGTRIKTDWYLMDKKTSQWWSPVSFTEGFVSDRGFFGGQDLGGVLGFFSDAGGFLTNFVSLGVLEGNFQIGQFYAPPVNAAFPFPVGKWFEIMGVLAADSAGAIGQGNFVKTPDTVANGFLDPRMAAGTILPVDGQAAGWVCTYPGVVDNPATVGVIEGVGLASTQFGQIAPTGGPLGLSTPLAAISLSGVQIGLGLDPTTAFVPDDAFVDDHTLAGVLFVQPNPIPDFIIPYHDDMELFFPGPVRVQTDRIFDSIASNAIISTQQNSDPAPGGSQSLAQITVNNDSLFRQENGETFPTFPQPVLGTLGADGIAFTGDPGEASAVARADFRMALTSQTGRSIRFVDGAFTGNFALTVLAGATDPNAGFAAADGKFWIRQPNVGITAGLNATWGTLPGFDDTVEGQDNLTQGNWWPALQWSAPAPSALLAGQSDFNNQFTNIPTGLAADGSNGVPVLVSAFNVVQVEVQPNPGQDEKNPFDEGLARVTINGSIVPNTARADGLWLAGGAGVSSVQYWSSNNLLGQGNTIHIDNVDLSGPLRVVPAGPAFTAPYTDDFELYNLGESIGGQGSTPFLNLGSLADSPNTDNSRKLTISTLAPSAVSAGTLVCRYSVDSVKFAAPAPLAPGEVVVMNYEQLPLPFNTLLDQNINCPGVTGASTPFVLRPHNGTTAENQPRLQAGNWTLLTVQIVTPGIPPAPDILSQFPEAYVPVVGDNTSLSYSTTTSARWGGSGPASLVVDDPTGGNMSQVLQIKSTFGVDGSLGDNPDFFAASALLPQIDSTPGALGIPSIIVDLWVYIYIESLDAAGLPVNVAPRSRFSMPFVGAGADAGRITTINFGGPNVNNIQALQGPPVVAPIIADDKISYMVDSGLTAPDTMFVDSGVSLTTGGLGLPSLLNKWISVHLWVRFDSTWDLMIDPDLGGPLAPITIATGAARDLGLPGTGGIGVLNTNSLDFFNARQGRDVGSGGEPIPANFRVRTLDNNAVVPNPQTSSANVTAPSNADKDADYCFYETTATPEFEIGGIPNLNAQIADEGAVADIYDAPRDLGPNNDVIAVVNRAYNSATNTVSGVKIFDPCPLNIASPINRFDLYDGVTPLNGILYTGRWGLLGQVGQAGVNNPPPAGGLGRIDGPALAVPVSYNDFTVQAAGFPATLASRPIIVCQWGSSPADATNGVDGFGTVFPRSRWFIDIVMLDTIVGPTPCADLTPGDGQNAVNASDLAQLLGQWGTAGSGDLNGDGTVNASDLAILLGNWGPCP